MQPPYRRLMPAFNGFDYDLGEGTGGKNMANPILVTGAAGRVGAVGRTVTELLLQQGKVVRATVAPHLYRRHRAVVGPSVS